MYSQSQAHNETSVRGVTSTPLGHPHPFDGRATDQVEVGLPLKLSHLDELPDLLVTSQIQCKVLTMGHLTESAHVGWVYPAPVLKVSYGPQLLTLNNNSTYRNILIRINCKRSFARLF